MSNAVDVKPADIISEFTDGVSNNPSHNNSNWYQELEKGGKKVELMEEKENDGILKRRERWSNWVLIFIGVIVVVSRQKIERHIVAIILRCAVHDRY